MKKLSALLILIIALASIHLSSLPWKYWAESYARSQLAAHGIKAQFTLARLEPGVVVITDISSELLPTGFELLELHYVPRDLLGKKLTVTSFVLRSKEGEVSTADIAIDLTKPAPASAVFAVKNLPLALVMKLLTAGRADATGMVSGRLPLTYNEDGGITVRNGVLTASKGGTIRVSPEAIPGDNAQVDVVRAVLTDFHYQHFTMTLNSGKDKQLSILLQLYGNNPSAYNGREVKLNVRLDGDLLGLYQQNVTAITDPKSLLEQHNEK